MQYGTQRISNETVSVYQGSFTFFNWTSNPVQSLDTMGVVDQRDADVYSMWKTVCIYTILNNNYIKFRLITLKQWINVNLIFYLLYIVQEINWRPTTEGGTTQENQGNHNT